MRVLHGGTLSEARGWGADWGVNQGLRDLGHTVFDLDYRRHRHALYRRLVATPPFDGFFLQRGDGFPAELLRAIRAPKVFWDTEHTYRHADHEQLYAPGLLDHVLFYTWEIAEFYIQRCGLRRDQCSIMVGGFEPTVHRKIPDVEQDIDVLFVAAETPRRQRFLEELRRHFRVDTPQVYGEELVKLINRARIVLNIHASDVLTAETRVFEVLGCGSFLLTEKLAPENPLPHGAIAEFTGAAELVEQVDHYLRHADARESIAARGHAAAHAGHTYRHRAEHVVRLLENAARSRGGHRSNGPAVAVDLRLRAYGATEPLRWLTSLMGNAARRGLRRLRRPSGQ